MHVFISIIFLICAAYSTATTANTLSNLTPKQLVIIANRADPSSEFIADYYQSAHDIPSENVIHVALNPEQKTLTRSQFYALANQINQQLTPHHKAILFVWSSPYQVECQSITSAFTLGFDPNICRKTCGPSQQNPYFNKPTNHILQHRNMRLSMLLPTKEIELATDVIDSGVKSRSGVFKSHAYYLQTSDKARNSRAIYFPKDGIAFKGTGLSVINKHAEYLEDVHDIMIYQTGAAHVQHLPTISFLPGALADHLTSYGGKLEGGGQMSVVEWLRAGATASYGSVSEPCNYWQKFPNSSVLLRWYVAGNTAIEAYWKSVAWPAQGLFVGDPLAQPFAITRP